MVGMDASSIKLPDDMDSSKANKLSTELFIRKRNLSEKFGGSSLPEKVRETINALDFCHMPF